MLHVNTDRKVGDKLALAAGGRPFIRLDENGERRYRAHKSTGSVPLNINSPFHLPNGQRLQVNSSLKTEDWRVLDEAVQKAQMLPKSLRQMFISRGMVRPEAITTIVATYSRSSQFAEPDVSITGERQPVVDRIQYKQDGTVVPVVSTGFKIGLRENPSGYLRTDNAEEASEAVAKKLEYAAFNGFGSAYQMAGFQAYGLLNYPNRNTSSGGDWGTIANIEANVLSAITAANTDRFYSGFHLFVPDTQYNQMLARLTDTEITALQRVLDIPAIEAVHQVSEEFMAAGQAVMLPMESKVFQWVMEMEIELREWVSSDGWTSEFRIVAVQSPMPKKDYDDRCGIVHITGI